MILTRLGNKRRIAHLIHPHFAPHNMYVELFFGAGGMFFNKPRVPYNICNDIDSEVYNLWQVVKEQPEALHKEYERLPLHIDVWETYKVQASTEPVLRASLFLMYSNMGVMGKPDTMKFQPDNSKQNVLDRISEVFAAIKTTQFMRYDFRQVLSKIHIGSAHPLVYADPPYLDTGNWYNATFTKADTVDLFAMARESKHPFAISEENHPDILSLAENNKLFVIPICERRSLEKRSTEILITNYRPQLLLF